jgi:colanic acid/amylovoran biosynthesis protein
MRERITIEVRGVEFVNKGAHLMLCAIREQVGRFDRPVRLVMEPSPRATPSQIRDSGLLPKSAAHVPATVARAMGRVHERDVDVVLDASGFAYGDAWGCDKADRRIARHIARWKAQGKSVVLLPQAFGPFARHDLADRMRSVFSLADRVYVRDDTSLAHVKTLHDGSNIVRMPDFTNLVDPVLPSDPARFAERVAIIPNIKMIEAVSDGSGYVDQVVRIIAAVRAEAREPFLLLHEAGKDVEVARQIGSRLTQPVDVVSDPDPLVIKGVIGASLGVVTSRFHGLVSALSQSVPCLATSWSHKYEELLAEYGYPDQLLRSTDQPDEPIRRLLDPDVQLKVRSALTAKADVFKEQSRNLWKDVNRLVCARA